MENNQDNNIEEQVIIYAKTNKDSNIKDIKLNGKVYPITNGIFKIASMKSNHIKFYTEDAEILIETDSEGEVSDEENNQQIVNIVNNSTEINKDTEEGRVHEDISPVFEKNPEFKVRERETKKIKSVETCIPEDNNKEEMDKQSLTYLKW